MRAVRFVVLPLLLLLCGLLLVGLKEAGADVVVASAFSWTTVVVVLVILERLIPYERRWHVPDGQLGNDLVHTLLGSALGARAGGLVVDGAVAALALHAPALHVWPAQWPLLGQVAVAFVVVDACRYAQHRVQHRVPLLWRTHVLHHDAERLIAIKAGRSHLLDRALQALCVLPVVAAGAGEEVVFFCVGFNSLVGLVAHANIDVGSVFFFVGPREHRVHHARTKELHDANFGAALTIWDRACGTFRTAEVRDSGLDEQTPRGVVAQLAAPLQR